MKIQSQLQAVLKFCTRLSFVCAGILAHALPAFSTESFQAVTVSKPGTPSLAASGNSSTPIVSKDGRYVLFASTANNLASNSNNLPFLPTMPPVANVFLRDRVNGTTVLVSMNTAGSGGGDADSIPVDISTNGQYVLFESSAGNLVSKTAPWTNNVFLRDVVHQTTLLISLNTNGVAGNGASRSSVMTPDGRYVAFVSAANDLVPLDSNRISDVFLRDTQAGTTTLISVSATNLTSTSSESPDISADGRYVAFYSTATNLVSGVTNSGEIYVRDTVAQNTIWASAFAHSVFPNSNILSANHVISADGQYVTYEACLTAIPSGNKPPFSGAVLRYNTGTAATDTITTNATGIQSGLELSQHSLDMTPDGRFVSYVSNVDSSRTNTSVYVWDANSGVSTLASGSLSSNDVATNSISERPVLDDSGHYVAFLSNAGNLVSNSVNGAYHLYLRDLQQNSTRLIDVDTNNAGSLTNVLSVARLSANGLIVAFEADGGGLVAGDDNGASDVFVRDIANQKTELISIRQPDFPNLGPNGRSTLSTFSVSANARYIAFSSVATNLVANDTNQFSDVFIRDLFTSSNILVSADATGVYSGNNTSTDSSISVDGRYVAFTSSSSNLVALDNNKFQDVFVRDTQLGVTKLVSVDTTGTTSGNADSYSPILSSNGRYVLFHSKAGNLASGVSGTTSENVYWRDLQSGATRVLSTNNNLNYPENGAMTPDGQFVVVSSFSGPLYVWNTTLNAVVYTNTLASIVALGISPDGNRIGIVTTGSINGAYAVDRSASLNKVIGTPRSTSAAGLNFSADSRYLTFTAIGPGSGSNQVYYFDFQTATSTLVSHQVHNLTVSANDNSVSPVISPDGRYIAYRSASTNIASNGTSGIPCIYLYDRTANSNTLVTPSVAGNGRSSTPVFSPDSQTLVFQSWTAGLVPQDFDQTGDIFALSLSTTNVQPPFATAILGAAGQTPSLVWPVAPGKNYQVQFKNQLSDPVWQVLNATLSTNGNQATLTDPAPANGQRFYRIVSF